jgi:hypothetical protein
MVSSMGNLARFGSIGMGHYLGGRVTPVWISLCAIFDIINLQIIHARHFFIC